MNQQQTRRTTLLSVIVLVSAAFLCLLPLAGKPFNIDDPLFVWTAKHICSHPADFYGFRVNWGGQAEPMFNAMCNPPLSCYYMALAARFVGWNEIGLHAAFLPAAIAAVLGTYFFARRFCRLPLLAALITLLTPAFLVTGTSVMCDTMMLAFWLWAAVLWCKGLEPGSKPVLLGLAALLMTACVLTKYYGLSLVPLLLAYTFAKKRKVGLWALYFLLPVAALLAYEFYTQRLYGSGSLFAAAAYRAHFQTNQALAARLLIGCTFTGGCVITALLYAPLLWSRKALALASALSLPALVLLAWLLNDAPADHSDWLRWLMMAQCLLFIIGALNIFALALADVAQRRDADSLLLALWVAGTFLFAAFFNWTTNGRSILPMVPPVAMLVVRQLERRARRPAAWRPFWPLAPAALIALSVAQADFALASSTRTAAAAIWEKHGSLAPAVWFQGHWGFQYYMELAGGRPVSSVDSRLTQGDLIVYPGNNVVSTEIPESCLRRIEALSFPVCKHITTMDQSLDAGFHSDAWGLLPYAFGPVPPERYDVFVWLQNP